MHFSHESVSKVFYRRTSFSPRHPPHPGKHPTTCPPQLPHHHNKVLIQPEGATGAHGKTYVLHRHAKRISKRKRMKLRTHSRSLPMPLIHLYKGSTSSMGQKQYKQDFLKCKISWLCQEESNNVLGNCPLQA